MTPFQNKIFLVTGATSGFGEAISRRAVKDGHKVIGTGRRKERLESLQKELGEKHFLPLEFDIRDHAAVNDAIKSIPKEWQEIDVLVNNAGLALSTETADKVPFEDWEQMIDTNIKGLLYATRAVLSGMLERSRGHIIMLGSISGDYPYKGGNVYGATKAFVKQFSLNLKTDLLGTPIRVTNLEPGMAETEFSLVRFRGNKAKAEDIYKGVNPLTADDIAECALWCASLPSHVNINTMEIMPVCQAPGGLAVSRT